MQSEVHFNPPGRQVQRARCRNETHSERFGPKRQSIVHAHFARLAARGEARLAHPERERLALRVRAAERLALIHGAHVLVHEIVLLAVVVHPAAREVLEEAPFAVRSSDVARRRLGAPEYTLDRDRRHVRRELAAGAVREAERSREGVADSVRLRGCGWRRRGDAESDRKADDGAGERSSCHVAGHSVVYFKNEEQKVGSDDEEERDVLQEATIACA
ncbi:hypothetical protein PybrP1_001818 [[Pythium] brassicae (nom. inval.)]|nr:hypothetical protein PybrP1_001818 [[Pythium] brassicae (nom. inval.)]